MLSCVTADAGVESIRSLERGPIFKYAEELNFEFLVAQIAIGITELAPSFFAPRDSFAQRAIILADIGKSVLENWWEVRPTGGI